MRVEYAHWKKDGGVRTRCTLLVALVVIVIISGSGVYANGGDNGHIDELNKLYEKLEKVKSEDILQADGEREKNILLLVEKKILLPISAGTKCTIGMYDGVSHEGKKYCIQCPIGYVQEKPGQNDCAACPTGKYVIEIGQPTCHQCPDDEDGSCQNQGKVPLCNPDDGSPLKRICGCPSGKYHSGEKCEECDSGQYQDAELLVRQRYYSKGY